MNKLTGASKAIPIIGSIVKVSPTARRAGVNPAPFRTRSRGSAADRLRRMRRLGRVRVQAAVNGNRYYSINGQIRQFYVSVPKAQRAQCETRLGGHSGPDRLSAERVADVLAVVIPSLDRAAFLAEVGAR